MDDLKDNDTSVESLNYFSGNPIYCSPEWTKFWYSVYPAIFYLLIVVYGLGLITNVLNVIVFTRKPMVKNPLNLILIALAVADFLFVVAKVVWFILWTTIDEPNWWPNKFSEEEHFHRNIVGFSQAVTHTLAMLYTLLVAFWRLLGIWKPFQSLTWLTSKNAIICIICCALLSMTLRVPILIYQFERSPTILYSNEVIAIAFSHWGPSILFVLLTGALISTLRSAKRTQTNLLGSTSTIASSSTAIQTATKTVEDHPNPSHQQNPSQSHDARSVEDAHRSAKFNNTTKMLIVICIIFIVVQSPYGLAYFGSVCVPSEGRSSFMEQCFKPAGAIIILLEASSTATAFFVYLSMSDRFRSTFQHIFGSTRDIISETLTRSRSK